MPVRGIGIHVEIYVSVACGIGMTFIDQPLYEIDDVSDILRGFQPEIGIVHVETPHHGIDVFNHIFRIYVGGDPRFAGFSDDFIVHVGIIARIRHFIAFLFEIFAHNIVNQRLIPVPHVRLARNGDAARVHFHLVLFHRHEFFFLPR